MAGRKRTPNKILEARGSRRARKHEPQPRLGAACPGWVSEAGKKLWLAIADELLAAQVFTKLDETAAGLLVDALADYCEARAIVDREGLITVTSKGTEIQHPAVGVRNQAWYRVHKMCVEFGMTPSSRAKAGRIEEPKDDPIERLLNLRNN